MTLGRTLLAALLLAGAACSALVDTRGLSGGGPASPGGGTASGASVNGSADATSSGGGTLPDGAPEVSPSNSFCGAHPRAIYCEDFDHVPPPSIAQRGRAQVTRAADARSAPNVFSTSLPPLQNGDVGWSYVESSPLPGPAYRIAADVLPLSGTNVVVLTLFARAGSNTYQMQVLGDSSYLVFQEFLVQRDGNTDGLHWTRPAPPYLTPEWHHIELCLHFDAKNVVLALDGVRLLDGSLLLQNWPQDSTVRAGIATMSGPAPETDVSIDNLIVDEDPCPP
jgi:hypothetical protein